ncbi:MAG TPA: hypothetical protein VEY70_18930 [Metabacillus sp.]|nr:hypothetical protein [Metabacillus sp.]
MKIDSKMRKIQQKYRDEIKFKNKQGKHAFEAAGVIFLFFLLLFVGIKFNFFDSDGIQPIPVDDFENRWMYVIPQIDDSLKNSSSVYTGIAIDFNPLPIKIILKTSFQKSKINDENILNELINLANENIKSNNLPASNETYEIIVIGSNNEEITRKVFNNS